MSSPLVSVIVPVYNAEMWLDRCLHSIVGQTYTNIEIILIDDGSEDASGTICENWKNTDKRIHVVHQKNNGPGGARNTGLDMCVGEYILFVDSDDFVEPTLIEDCVKCALVEKADIVLFNFCYERDRANRHPLNISSRWDSRAIYEGILSDSIPSYPFKFFKHSLWMKKRFPVGMVWEDFIVMPEIFQQSRKSVFLDKVLYHYEKGNPYSVSRQVRSVNKYCWFCGWRFRKALAEEEVNLPLFNYALVKSLKLAVTAIGLNTCDHLLSMERVQELSNYIQQNMKKPLPNIGAKYRFLLWARNQFPYALKLYGRIALAMARIKRHFGKIVFAWNVGLRRGDFEIKCTGDCIETHK